MARKAKTAKKERAANLSVIRVFGRPGEVVEREALYKQLVDLMVGMTGHTEKFACLLMTGTEITVRLSDNEYDARHGSEVL